MAGVREASGRSEGSNLNRTPLFLVSCFKFLAPPLVLNVPVRITKEGSTVDISTE
jgi:hypothetical protein